MCFHTVTLLLDQMDLIASLEGLKKLFVQFSLFLTCNMLVHTQTWSVNWSYLLANGEGLVVKVLDELFGHKV